MAPPSSEDRLSRLRGPIAPQAYTARKITALTANPGCSRRAVLDAAGVDKDVLAARVGFGARFGQSPFAISRGNAFEDLVKADGYAAMFTLLRTELDIPVREAGVADLNTVGANTDLKLRAAETRRLLRRVAQGSDERLILDHPVLTLQVAGQTAYLEPDAVTHRIGGRFYIAEIKSFAAIDGQADPGKVAEAAKQAAVYVIALRQTLAALGLDAQAAAAAVADQFLLICPKDFANQPYGRLVDLRQKLDAIEFQLGRLGRAEDLAALLPADATFDLTAGGDGRPARTGEELARALDHLDAAYHPACLDFCELARYCRNQATTACEPARLGASVRNELPGIDSTRTALRLIDAVLDPDPAQAEIVERLRAGDRLRARRIGGAA
ncbi:hypothetical protein ABZ904_37355 [Streptomyces sp. NPDC046900]|uniref:hypothetical protein n=1 Tax=Streptomyces sp. NPDC046900 TaxID=3155473 RepID=UPI0033CF2F9C